MEENKPLEANNNSISQIKLATTGRRQSEGNCNMQENKN